MALILPLRFHQMTTVTRPLLVLTGLMAALVLDLGLPTWTQVAVLPCCLDLAWLAVCCSTRGASCVFWAGLAGAGHDFVQGIPIGTGVISAATVALVFAIRNRPVEQQVGIVDQVLSCLMLLLLLGFVRTLCGAVLEPTSFPPDFRLLTAQLALTFLTATACSALVGLFGLGFRPQTYSGSRA